jgi:hypothetical protein
MRPDQAPALLALLVRDSAHTTGTVADDGLELLGTKAPGATVPTIASPHGSAGERAGNIVWRWTNRTPRLDDGSPSPGPRPDRVAWLLSVLPTLRELDVPTLGRLAELATSDDADRMAIVDQGLETIAPERGSFDELLELCSRLRGRAGSRLAADLLPSSLEDWSQLRLLVRDSAHTTGTVADDHQRPLVLAAGIRHLRDERNLPLDADTFAGLLCELPRWSSQRADIAVEFLDEVDGLDDRGLDRILSVIESTTGRTAVQSTYATFRLADE